MPEIADLPESLRLLVERAEHATLKSGNDNFELDTPENIFSAERWLSQRDSPPDNGGTANNSLYAYAAMLKDYGVSQARAEGMLAEHLPGYGRIEETVASAYRRGNDPGARATTYGVKEVVIATDNPEPKEGEVFAGDELTLYSGADVEPEAIDWLWPGHYARGKFHLFAAKPETGKNLITMSIAAILSREGRWPDGVQAPLGDTLIWSGEDSFKDTTLPRYMASGGDRRRLHGIGTLNDPLTGRKRPFDPASDVPALIRAMEKIPALRYVVIDPVSVVVSAGKGASNNDAEVRRALQPLLDMAEKRGVVVEGITHFAKDSNRRAVLERILASTAFGAVARVVHVAAKFDDIDKPRVWVRAKCNVVKTSREIGFEFQSVEADVPGYPLRAPKVVWGEPANGTAGALIEEEEKEDMSKHDFAAAWLTQFLKDEPGRQATTKEVMVGAHANGINPSTLEKARMGLPIRAVRNLGATTGWSWKWIAEEAPVLW